MIFYRFAKVVSLMSNCSADRIWLAFSAAPGLMDLVEERFRFLELICPVRLRRELSAAVRLEGNPLLA